MFPTVKQQPLREDRSTQKEEYQLANAVRDAANLTSRTRADLTTAGTGAYTAIWTSEDMPVGSLWALDASVIGLTIAPVNCSRYERTALFSREAAVTAQIGATGDFAPVVETDPAADARFAIVGNAIAVQVRDNGQSTDWDAVITAREIT